MKWTPERIERARWVLGMGYSERVAATMLSGEWGEEVTRGALNMALRHAEPRDTIRTEPAYAVLSDADAETYANVVNELKAQAAEATLHAPFEGVQFGAGTIPLRKLFLIPDVHRPYHHEASWRICLAALRHFAPDIVVTLGDFGDFYTVSSHDKDPSRRLRLEDEVKSINDGLGAIQEAAPNASRYFVAGNHEDRLERYLMTKAPEMYAYMKIPELLRLTERGWHYTPYKQTLQIGKLHITHDVGNAGQFAHMKAQQTFEGNVVIGHTHRMGVSYAGNAKGETHVGAHLGWLGDVEAIDYMHRVAALRAWQLGFGVGYLTEGGHCHLQAVPIVEGMAIVEGKAFR